MDTHAVSRVILTLISFSYPGGSAKFEEEGGLVVPLPQIRQCLIYHPNPPNEFKKKLNNIKVQLGEGLPDIVFSFIDRLNFEGMTTEEISGQIQVAVEELYSTINISTILVTPNPVITFITIPGITFNDETILQKIINIFTNNVEKLIRLVIISENKFYPLDLTESEGIDEIVPIKPVVEQSDKIPDRVAIKRIIEPDDITNLRIELALCNDVNDFINKM